MPAAGRIEPTMNFAGALRRLEAAAEITALGTVRGLDTTLIPARGYPLEHPAGAAAAQTEPGPADRHPRDERATQPGSGPACDPTGRY
jgi:UDP-N-acetylglucosamine--N-acetylmuramyl-(pentapeptide) pyrophosphoryl-undecaprenol N-acetylglucosamine transferase